MDVRRTDCGVLMPHPLCLHADSRELALSAGKFSIEYGLHVDAEPSVSFG